MSEGVRGCRGASVGIKGSRKWDRINIRTNTRDARENHQERAPPRTCAAATIRRAWEVGNVAEVRNAVDVREVTGLEHGMAVTFQWLREDLVLMRHGAIMTPSS